ncbi:MAG: CHAT domain-containing protein [Bacteroidota bacterium]
MKNWGGIWCIFLLFFTLPLQGQQEVEELIIRADDVKKSVEADVQNALPEAIRLLKKGLYEELHTYTESLILPMEDLKDPDSLLYAQVLWLQNKAAMESSTGLDINIHLQYILELNPSLTEAWIDYADLSFRAEDYPNAFIKLFQAKKSIPKEEWPFLYAAQLRYATLGGFPKEGKKAIAFLDSLPRNHPVYPEVMYFRQMFDRHEGKLKDRISLKKSYQEIEPVYLPNMGVRYDLFHQLLKVSWENQVNNNWARRTVMEKTLHSGLLSGLTGELHMLFYEEMARISEGVIPPDSIMNYLKLAEKAATKTFPIWHLSCLERILMQVRLHKAKQEYTKSGNLIEDALLRLKDNNRMDIWAAPLLNLEMASQFGSHFKEGRKKKALQDVLKYYDLRYPDGYEQKGNVLRVQAALKTDKNMVQQLDFLHQSIEADTLAYGQDSPHLIPTYQLLSEKYMIFGNLDLAREFQQKALGIAQNQSRTGFYSLVSQLAGMANIELAAKHFKEANELAQQAKEQLNELVPPHDHRQVELDYLLGNIQRKLGENDSALRYFEKAFSGYFPSFEDYRSGYWENEAFFKPYSYELMNNMLGSIGEIYVEKGDYTEALLAYKSLQIWMNYYRSLPHGKYAPPIPEYIYQNCLTALLHTEQQLYQKSGNKLYLQEAFGYSELAKRIAIRPYLFANPDIRPGKIPKDILNNEETVSKSLVSKEKVLLESRLYRAPNQRREKANFFYESSLKSYHLCEEKIKKRLPFYHHLKYEQRLVYSGEIIDKLGDSNTLIISYSWDRSGTLFAYAFGNSASFGMEIDLPKDFPRMLMKYIQMNKEGKEIQHSAMDSSFFATYTGLSSQLYNILLQKLLQETSEESYSNLLILADKELRFLPFETLLTSEQEYSHPNYQDLPYLIKQYHISYEWTANPHPAPEAQQEDIPYLSYLGLAPELAKLKKGGQNEILKVNQYEVGAAYPILGGKALLGDLATFEALKEYLNETNILHISTAVRCTDSLPFAYHFLLDGKNNFGAFDLEGRQLQAKLALFNGLSFEAEEGLNGLWSLLYAGGCPSMVYSRWVTANESQTKIATSFFTYIQQGIPRGEAIRRAKLDYLEAGLGNLHPHFWNGFALMGDTGSVVVQTSLITFQRVIILILVLAGIILGAWGLSRSRGRK